MTQEEKAVHWHATDPEEAFKRLHAGKEGLSEDRARQRLEETGPNSLEAEEGSGPLRLLARQVHNPLIYLLAGAAVLAFLIGHRVDAAVIAGVIVLNTLLGFFQEWRAEGALEALREMAAPHARVLRDGQPAEIDASHLVPGDLLLLETGDRVAADALLLSGDNLQVDESALTGESQPVTKQPGKVNEDTPMAFQWFQAFNARSNYQSVFEIGLFSNRWVLVGVGVAILLQIGAVHTSIGQLLFRTTGLSPADWFRIFLVSSSIWVADEILKRFGVYGRPPKRPWPTEKKEGIY